MFPFVPNKKPLLSGEGSFTRLRTSLKLFREPQPSTSPVDRARHPCDPLLRRSVHDTSPRAWRSTSVNNRTRPYCPQLDMKAPSRAAGDLQGCEPTPFL